MKPEIKRCSCCKWEKPIVWDDFCFIPSLSKNTKGKSIIINLCFDCLVQLDFPEVIELKKLYKNNIKECLSCDKPFMITPGKEWAIKCPSCWIKENTNKNLSSEEFNFIITAKEKRRLYQAQDNEELQMQRMQWCNKLLIQQIDPMIKVLEMYLDENGEAVKGPLFVPQYFHEYILCNTRTKLLTETRFECDKLPFEKAIKIIFEVSEQLYEKGFSHYIFYSEGQRSPHIIIYDFVELENLEPHYRYKCQENFWRYIVPFHVHYADKGLWLDEHEFVPLEYATHWKTGNPFLMIREVKCNDRNYATAAT